MLTSIIILTHNQLPYTKECIQSIRTYTESEEYELIIVDNASTDGTVEWLISQPDIIVIKNTTNMGFPKGCNQGILKARGDNVLLLNNDVIVTERWLKNLLTCLYKHENIAAVGPVTNSASYDTTIPAVYTHLKEMHQFASRHNVSDEKKWERRLKLIGFCLLIKRNILDEVGLLDEQFTPGNYEDDDICLRIAQRGYTFYLCKDTFVHHYGSLSWKENVQEYAHHLTENAQKFENKWNFSATDLDIHKSLVNQLQHNFPLENELKILHVGSGCGATLLEIQNRYPHFKLFGVESNYHAHLFSKQIATTLCIPYENVAKAFTDTTFHAILLTIPTSTSQFKKICNSLSTLLTTNGLIYIPKS
ncbi:glycosyltransferase family 2 protein [Bacillus cereus]|uniref:glycosyltransferase family 2 protein n=1 Tax=Bacillus cereus TaxID=1396 RepID=UPI0018CEE3A0|nr:glycosyltransferase family 2 protein [Bacillus cereus]MBG9617620.1 glycosyl transferase [Bacillus cereus]